MLSAVSSDGRESYLRALVRRDPGGWVLSLTGHQGSGNQHSLVAANAIAIIPAGVTRVIPGDPIEFWRFSK
jgi:molybdopterin molybdotransferase